MSKYFMELGAKVAITSRNLERLQNTAKEMESETGKQNTDINSEIQSCQQRFFVYRSPRGRIKKTGTPKFEMLGKSADKKVAGNRGSLAFFLPFL